MLLGQVHLEDDKLHIDQEGRSRKFTNKVQQKTFAASSANGRPIMYVTERAVFKLIEGKGLELVEVAPGMQQYIQHTPLPTPPSLLFANYVLIGLTLRSGCSCFHAR